MSKASAVCVIPARLESSRLPRKLLLPLGEKPVIRHVWEQAMQATDISRVIVACDHQDIKNCVESFGGQAVMTRSDHPSGTSRICEIAGQIAQEIVINVQGDEPFISPRAITLLVEAMKQSPEYQMATLYTEKTDLEGFNDPNVVKVVINHRGEALYFSRAPIPYGRDTKPSLYLKHIGVYGYRRSFLLSYDTLQPSQLEKTERLEQLRALENGIAIKAVKTNYDSVSIDTAEDLERARHMAGLPSSVRAAHQ
jgi:3-deoxy-manno-octulosonate cytidylyltransferase (CMP-KDO synthetase)